jgi:DNA-binding beta-propeller fold protein YncE
MKKSVPIFLAVSFLFALKTQSQVDEPLKLVQTIPLPGLHDGDFDHSAVDVPGQRLFLAAEENSAVEVIDLRTNKLIHTIAGPKAPHSMAYNTDSKKLFVVDGGSPSQVEIYDGTSYEFLGAISMEAHADASIYDPVGKLFYVGNGGRAAKEDYCLISVVDTASDKKVGDIRVDSDRVEGMALEMSGPRLFVNLTPKNAVAVIDRKKRTVIDTWSISDEGRSNAPMAFDEAGHRLFVVASDPTERNPRHNGKVVVLDSDSGKIVSTLPGVAQYFSDDAVFDAESKRLYIAGVPHLNVFQERANDRYDFVGQVPVSFHAVTAILVPQLNRYYVPVNHHGDKDAVVQVYEVQP